jgi:hypothetical protein
MPNYCNNELTITSDNTGFLQSLMNELKQADSYEVDFLSMLVPFTEKTNYQWDYDWCVQNWGTKWDIFDVNYASLEGDTLAVSFMTAWSPPVAALETAMRKHGFTFDLYYEEGGACFIGHAVGTGKASIDNTWETLTDQHPEEYIPEDVLDAFPYVVSDWEEYQQERDQEELKELQGA